jgi:hypothetical protein
MALLRRGDLPVTDVCLAVGFTSLGSFSSTFTRLVGEPPSAYRGRDHTAMAPVPACVARTWTRPGWLGLRAAESRSAESQPAGPRPGGPRPGGPRAEPGRIGEARPTAERIA